MQIQFIQFNKMCRLLRTTFANELCNDTFMPQAPLIKSEEDVYAVSAHIASDTDDDDDGKRKASNHDSDGEHKNEQANDSEVDSLSSLFQRIDDLDGVCIRGEGRQKHRGEECDHDDDDDLKEADQHSQRRKDIWRKIAALDMEIKPQHLSMSRLRWKEWEEEYIRDTKQELHSVPDRTAKRVTNWNEISCKLALFTKQKIANDESAPSAPWRTTRAVRDKWQRMTAKQRKNQKQTKKQSRQTSSSSIANENGNGNGNGVIEDEDEHKYENENGDKHRKKRKKRTTEASNANESAKQNRKRKRKRSRKEAMLLFGAEKAIKRQRTATNEYDQQYDDLQWRLNAMRKRCTAVKVQEHTYSGAVLDIASHSDSQSKDGEEDSEEDECDPGKKQTPHMLLGGHKDMMQENPRDCYPVLYSIKRREKTHKIQIFNKKLEAFGRIDETSRKWTREFTKLRSQYLERQHRLQERSHLRSGRTLYQRIKNGAPPVYHNYPGLKKKMEPWHEMLTRCEKKHETGSRYDHVRKGLLVYLRLLNWYTIKGCVQGEYEPWMYV